MGKKAALLSAVEVGLGSVLHGFKVPFAGHYLSLNQGFILTWASRQIPSRSSAGVISTTAALLKSLSPAGKKLTPMLAIAVQGQLFGLGALCLGQNFLGHTVGMLLLSLWGFLQPLLLYYLLYGKAIMGVASFYLKTLSPYVSIGMPEIGWSLIGAIALKLVAGVLCVALAHFLTERHLARYAQWALRQKPQERKRMEGPVYLLALRDLFSPLFIVSWALTLVFFFYADHQNSVSIWLWMRPLAVGYLLFLIVRILPVERITPWLITRSPRLAATLDVAIKTLRQGR